MASSDTVKSMRHQKGIDKTLDARLVDPGSFFQTINVFGLERDKYVKRPGSIRQISGGSNGILNVYGPPAPVVTNTQLGTGETLIGIPDAAIIATSFQSITPTTLY